MGTANGSLSSSSTTLLNRFDNLVADLQDELLLRIRPHWRSIVWIALLGLTGFILASPVELKLDTTARLSPDIFPNLPLFGSLLSFWVGALLILAIAPSSNTRFTSWERFFLIMLVGLVFRGFWNLKVPIQGQAYMHLNAAAAWEAAGHVVRHPAGAYFDWPGVSLLYSVLHQTSGLSKDVAVSILGLLISVTMAASTYVFVRSILGEGLSAFFASILIVIGNLAAIIYLTAGPTAFVMVVAFLGLLFGRRGLRERGDLLTLLVLLASTSITHFHSSMHFFFLLVPLLLIDKGSYREISPAVMFISMVAFVIPTAWLLYRALDALVWSTRAVWEFLSHPFDIWGRLVGVGTITESNFGSTAPLWYRLTRFAWLTVLYLPAAGWLWNLLKWRRLGAVERTLTGAFGGLVALGVLSGLLSSRGFGELLREAPYVPFFAAPLLFRALNPRLSLRSGFWRKISAGALLILAFPTFLADNHRVNMLAPHQTEYAAGEWLSSMYGRGEGLAIFVTHPIVGTIQRALLDARFTTDQEAESTGYTRESRWNALEGLVDAFRNSPSSSPRFFVHSPRIVTVSSLTLNVPTDDPRWRLLAESINSNAARVYQNGAVVIYFRQQ